MGCSNSKKAEANGQSGGDNKKPVKPSAASQQKDKSENKRFEDDMEFIKRVPLFKRLAMSDYPKVTAAFESKNYKAGSQVITQGEEGDAFFVIKEGEASVKVKNESGEEAQIATLKGGDYFGEGALIRKEPRGATVVASTGLTCLVITRDAFEGLGLSDTLQFAKRQAVAAKPVDKNAANQAPQGPTAKTDSDKQLIAQAIKGNKNLTAMLKINDEMMTQLVNCAWKKEVPAGTTLIEQGDLVADHFYVVQKGEFDILVASGGSSGPAPSSAEAAISAHERFKNVRASVHAGGTDVSNVGTQMAGGSFGELALLHHAPRAATVKCTGDAIVWVIGRDAFKAILMTANDQKVEEYAAIINQVELLNVLLQEEKRSLAEALIEMHFQQGEYIIRQGEQGSTFYILYDGEVDVEKDGKRVNGLTAQSKKAGQSTIKTSVQMFGSNALLENAPRNASIKVTSKAATVLALDRESFNLLLGPLSDILAAEEQKKKDGRPSRKAEGIKATGRASLADVKLDIRNQPNRQDLEKLGLLGCGGFGAVTLERHKVTKETYALKALSKGFICKMGMQESCMNEKMILSMTNSPFIIKLSATYNGSQHLYFLLEPALGGELFAIYHRKSLHGSEKHAKFYTACVVKGFEHLHERRIIYRDLKPENLLLNDKGFCKITDMGLAKFVIGRTYTTCGTPDYFAPEVIQSTGHTKAVDWWTMGILVYELMSGHPPFESSDPQRTYAKVMQGIDRARWNQPCFKPEIEALVKSLCKRDPSERLPMRPGGVGNLTTQAWYKDFDWDGLTNFTMKPPYVPKVKDPSDMSNFHAHEEDMPPHIPYTDPGTDWDKDFATS